MRESSNKISTILNNGKGTNINLCYAYIVVLNSEDKEFQSDALEYLCENYDSAESCEEVEIDAIISSNEEKVLEGKFSNVADEMIKSLVNQNLSKEEFYQDLWLSINSPFFRDDRAKSLSLLRVLSDKRIPYYQIPDDGKKMNNADFKEIRLGLYEKTAKIRFLLTKEFSQKTEQADHILRVLDECSGDEKIVLMTMFIKEAKGKKGELGLLEKLVQAL